MRSLLLTGLTMIAIGCEDIPPGTNPIDSDIQIETKEVLEPGSRRLTFHCKTEREYPCINYQLRTAMDRRGGQFSIAFISVDGPGGICFTVVGPAQTTIDFGATPNGEYDIEFNNAEIRNRGNLKVTDTDIVLDFAGENGIEILRRDLKRVPPNTYWGSIRALTSSSANQISQFLQKFSDQGARFIPQLPGDYFYYEIGADGQRVQESILENRFIFQFDGDASALHNLIEVEGRRYKDDLQIEMMTYKGDRLSNW